MFFLSCVCRRDFFRFARFQLALRARASLARRAVRPRGFFTVRAAAAPPCECEIEGDSRVAKVNGKDVSAAALRNVSVMDRRGATINLGEQIGDKGVLVLLRPPPR